jgi:putative transposase
MVYRHARPSVSLVNLHFVWTPKYRRQVLVGGVKARAEQVIRQVAKEHKWDLIALEVRPDHVHLFVSVDPRVSPHLAVRAFKGRTSRVLREDFPHLLRMNTLWTRSYFVGTAGNASSATIEKYIEAQWDHGTPKDR